VANQKCCTKVNVDLVNDLVLSQEDTPQTHRTVPKILIISSDVYIVHTVAFVSCVSLKKVVDDDDDDEIATMMFGSCLLLEHSVIMQKCTEFEHLTFSR